MNRPVLAVVLWNLSCCSACDNVLRLLSACVLFNRPRTRLADDAPNCPNLWLTLVSPCDCIVVMIVVPLWSRPDAIDGVIFLALGLDVMVVVSALSDVNVLGIF